MSELSREDIVDIVKSCAMEAAADVSTVKIREAVKAGMMDTFELMGVDTKNPDAMRRDFLFLRDMRRGSDKIKGKALIVTVGIFVSGILFAAWQGFKMAVNKGGP